MLLSVKNLSTHFNAGAGKIARAVDGVSFDLEQGKTLALVGESGCGKTQTAFSIIKLIAENGYHPSGKVFFEDRDLSKLDQEEMRLLRGNDIAMIFQEPMASFAPAITIGNQMVEQLLIHTSLTKKEAAELSVEMLERVGINEPGKRFFQYAFELSGGMRQRAMIAMALSTKPKILIADEPTTALDVTIQAQVLELMKDLVKEFGMAILFITHDLGVIAQVADRVAVMYLGRIVESGPVREVLHAPVHPYTKRLISSIPVPDPSYDRKVYDINFDELDSLIDKHGSDNPMIDIGNEHYIATHDVKGLI